MSTTPQASGGMPPAMPPKKSNALIWILGGCGTLIFLVILVIGGLYFYGMHKIKQAGIDPELVKKNPALATAKMAVFVNPDVELVSNDDNAGTMVIRDKKTGKITKLKFDAQKKTMVITDEAGKTSSISADTEKGTFEVKNDEGTVKIGANADKPPDWVPIYPGSSPKNTYSSSDAKEQSGTYIFETPDTPEKIMSYYGDQLKTSGLKVSTTTNTSDGKVTAMVTAEDSERSRTVIVTATQESDGTKVNVVFHSRK